MKKIILSFVLLSMLVISVQGAVTDGAIHSWFGGTGASDRVGTMDATLNGGSLTPGLVHDAYTTTTQGQWASIEGFGWAADAPFTYTVLFKETIPIGSTQYPFIFNHRTDSPNSGMSPYILDDGTLSLQNSLWEGETGCWGALSTSNVADGEWHELTIVRDGQDRILSYIDGVYETTITEPDCDMEIIPTELKISYRLVNGDERWYVGQVGELTVFDVAKNASEISQIWAIHQQGASIFDAPACTPVWECSGYTQCDQFRQNCNAVVDANECGESYTGNYSEFPQETCGTSSNTRTSQNVINPNSQLYQQGDGKQGSTFSLAPSEKFNFGAWIEGIILKIRAFFGLRG